jgi:ADP-ribose pyrophosphatase YjhB (NUDIX family)
MREVKEETGIDTIPLGVLNVLSDPDQDPRWHVVIVSVLMRASYPTQQPKGADDALLAQWEQDSDELADKLIESSKISLNDFRRWKMGTHNLMELR